MTARVSLLFRILPTSLTILTLTSSHHYSFFLADVTGWQRISVLWEQNWIDMGLDQELGARSYVKLLVIDLLEMAIPLLTAFVHYH
jgi:hypothetical protein